MKLKMKILFLLSVLIAFPFTAAPAYALNPGNYFYFRDGAGAVDVSEMVGQAIENAAINMGSQIKDSTGSDDTSVMQALMSASMATEWFAVRSVLFGVQGIDKVGDMVSGGKMDEYKKMVAVGYIFNILKNYVGDQTSESAEAGKEAISQQAKEIVDAWDGKSADHLISQLQPLMAQIHDIGGSSDWYYYSGGSSTDASLAPIASDIARLEAIAASAERMKGIPGIDSEAGSLYDRMNVIGFSLLGLAFIAQLAWSAFLHAKGDFQGNLGSTVIKYVTIIFVLIAVPHIVLFGISIADSIKDLILNPSGSGNGTDQYRALQLALEMRTAASGVANSSWSVTAALTNGLTYAISVLAQAVIYILLILGDVMLAISILAGPLVIPLSLLPSFGDYLSKWFKGIVTFLMYPIAAAMYSVLLSALVMSSLDVSTLTILIISICYLMGALKIPNIAEQMNGAVMASVAAGIAAAPMKAAGAGLGTAGSLAGAGLSKIAGKSADT